MCWEFVGFVDDVVCVIMLILFLVVGELFWDFWQVIDEEVCWFLVILIVGLLLCWFVVLMVVDVLCRVVIDVFGGVLMYEVLVELVGDV